MKISIIANMNLDVYLEILNDYQFQATEYFNYRYLEIQNPISKGTIEITHLEDLFTLSQKLHDYYKGRQVKNDDLLIIRFVDNEFLLEIYDGYRE